MLKRRAILPCLLWVISGLGCSKSHTVASLDTDAETGAATDVRRAYCEYVERCEPHKLIRFGGTVEQCVAFEACDPSGFGTEQDTSTLAACADALATARCPNSHDFSARLFVSLCDEITHPPAQEGQACVTQGCDEGLFCQRNAEQDCPVCVPVRKAGESCRGGVVGLLPCEEGTYCELKGLLCTKLTEDDDACSDAEACAQQAGVGEACRTDHSDCDPRLICEEGKCVERSCRIGNEGERCPCAADLYCGSEGRCARRGRAGDPCSPSNSGGLGLLAPSTQSCEQGLFCDGARCVARAAVGERCAAEPDACDDGLYCVFDADSRPTVCAALKDDGEACTSPFVCRSGRCYGGKCGNVACEP